MSVQQSPRAAKSGTGRAVARFCVKLLLTVGAFYLLLTHHVTDAEGNRVTAFAVIRDFLPRIDLGLFLRFVVWATLIKFVGILASMYRWLLLLRGQGIELPFRHVFGSFLIGRFLGTFLPSTIGLDGYKLYDAARFSGRTVEASGATLVEKVIGFTGIFMTYLVALPLGVSIFGDRAGQVLLLTLPVALLPLAACGAIFLWPGPRLIAWATEHIPLGPYAGPVTRLAGAVSAYGHRAATVGAAAALSFVVHFTTAAMYFFTALAIGVTAADASFWQVTFASTIQILATVLSPFTIAGEGIREIAQYYLLSHLMGPAEAIVSAALGFWAAEALTLLGGVIWWTRGRDYAPAYCRVRGTQVDYAAAARAARDLGFAPVDNAARTGAVVDPFLPRVLGGLLFGLGGGLLAGSLLGAGEALLTIRLAGPGEDAQVLWYGVILYGLLCGGVGTGTGGALAFLPLPARLLDRLAPVVSFVAGFLPLGVAVSLFRLKRDAYAEQSPPLATMLAVVLAAVVLTAGIGWLIARAGHAPLDRATRGRARTRRFTAACAAWLGLAGLGAAGATVLGPWPATPRPPARTGADPAIGNERPSVVLVIVDTLRADHLGAYGDPRGLSPHMDALARDGTALEAFAQSSWTKPSIATILTSLYAASHQAMSKTAILPDSAITVAEALADAGYTTAGFVSNINLAPSFNFQQGFAEYTYLAPDYLFGARESSSKLVLYSILRKVWFTVNKARHVNQYYQDSRTVNGLALPWVERHARDRFFLLVHYMDPHDPYFHHPYNGEGIARVENPNPPAGLAPRMRELYAGEVRFVDEGIGHLVDALRGAGIYGNTAIVVTSDHGEEFHEHGGWWHGTTLYNEAIAVPLIVKWPAGVRVTADQRAPRGQARLLDVAPTILSLAGVAQPPSWQGADLRSGIPADRVVFAEEDHEGNVLSAVQTADWKLLTANPGNPRGLPPLELYDRASDPGEDRNLADRRPAEVERLQRTLAAMSSEAAQQAVADRGETEMDSVMRERLRALGYLQ
jgi:arylsulfatase A-like enzyme